MGYNIGNVLERKLKKGDVIQLFFFVKINYLERKCGLLIFFNEFKLGEIKRVDEVLCVINSREILSCFVSE